jgi:hypothetical protein
MLKESDFPTIDEIAKRLEHIPAQVEPDMREHESEEPRIDVRLQVRDIDLTSDGPWWTVHTGDASYDQDHRGFWGSGCVVADDTPETLRSLADMLREDAIEDAAMCQQLDTTDTESEE